MNLNATRKIPPTHENSKITNSNFYKDLFKIKNYQNRLIMFDKKFKKQMNRLTYSSNKYCHYNPDKLYSELIDITYAKAKYICEMERLIKTFERFDRNDLDLINGFLEPNIIRTEFAKERNLDVRKIYRLIEKYIKQYDKILIKRGLIKYT